LSPDEKCIAGRTIHPPGNEVFRGGALPGTKVREMVRGREDREDREDRKGLEDNVRNLIESNTHGAPKCAVSSRIN